MNKYEAVVILKSNSTEEDLKEFKSSIAELISSDGEVTKVDDWKIKKLAYEIKHEKEGYYLFYNFECKPKFVEELERVLRLNDSVLKHMVIKLNK